MPRKRYHDKKVVSMPLIKEKLCDGTDIFKALT